MGSWFELRDGADGAFHVVLRAGDGAVLLQRGPFRCWSDALDGIEKLRRRHAQAEGAGIVSLHGQELHRATAVAGSTGGAAL